MVYQAYIDDSEDADGTYVLAGHIATTEQWVNLSKEWQELLPFASLDKDGKFNFHMVEMAQSSERMERVLPFRRVIEKHVICSVAVQINRNDLGAAIKRVCVLGADVSFSHYKHPFIFAMIGLMRTLNDNRLTIESLIPQDAPLHFFFDETSHEKLISSTWEQFTHSIPDKKRHLFSSLPRFGNDKSNLPLQAADLWAWWVRKRYAQGERDKLFGGNAFDHSIEQRYVPKIFIEYGQDKITKILIDTVKSILGNQVRVFDVNLKPDNGYSVRFSLPKSFSLNKLEFLALHR